MENANYNDETYGLLLQSTQSNQPHLIDAKNKQQQQTPDMKTLKSTGKNSDKGNFTLLNIYLVDNKTNAIVTPGSVILLLFQLLKFSLENSHGGFSCCLFSQ